MERFVGSIDPDTMVPSGVVESYRLRPRVPKSIVVRRAATGDAEASAALLVASITTLCIADHENDPATLERWLRNKTPEHFERWVADPANLMFVAELDTTLAGVALLHESGTVHLCYVLPGMHRHGVGQALIRRVELEATNLGLAQLRLKSSGSARGFYERLGFVPNGEPSIAFGVLEGYPYVKELRTAEL
jgi:GNAT superfamily N-acetyltransferase